MLRLFLLETELENSNSEKTFQEKRAVLSWQAEC